MADTSETFFTAVGCMDGRVQEVIARFGTQKFGATYPDTITEAGLVGELAKETVNAALEQAVTFKIVDVSIGKHHAKGVIVHGHAECAGNPVADEQQKEDIRRSVEFVASLVGPSVPVTGVFVHRSSSDPSIWEAEEVHHTVSA